jgi:hypothetical protein
MVSGRMARALYLCQSTSNYCLTALFPLAHISPSVQNVLSICMLSKWCNSSQPLLNWTTQRYYHCSSRYCISNHSFRPCAHSLPGELFRLCRKYIYDMATNGTNSANDGANSTDDVTRTLNLTYIALAISTIALILSTLQSVLAYLQFDNSEIGRRRCSEEVMGELWAGKTTRKFKWGEWRYQVFFEVPVLYTAPPGCVFVIVHICIFGHVSKLNTGLP